MAPDKKQHLIAGSAIAALSALGATWAGLDGTGAVALAFGAAALAGAAKEGIDALPVAALWLALG